MNTRDQDTDEIGQLYDQYGAALLLFASAMARDRATAQDAVHHVFLKLIENGSLRKASDQKALLFACVRNAVLNDTELRRRDTMFEADSLWFDPPSAGLLGREMFTTGTSGAAKGSTRGHDPPSLG